MQLTDEVIHQFEKIGKIQSEKSTDYFFKTLIDFEVPNQDEGVKHRLTSILSRYCLADKLNVEERYLGEVMKKAEQSDAIRRFVLFSHMGDYGLFISGVFPQSIHNKKGVDKSYYSNFGKIGYQSAAASKFARNTGHSKTFETMSFQFDSLVDRLNHLAEHFIPPSKELMEELMVEEHARYKETGDETYKNSAQKRAEILKILPSQFPSLFH